jgi:hypothetical protein
MGTPSMAFLSDATLGAWADACSRSVDAHISVNEWRNSLCFSDLHGKKNLMENTFNEMREYSNNEARAW